jgi:L-fuconate dehydratase
MTDSQRSSAASSPGHVAGTHAAIDAVSVHDRRFPLAAGEGTDAVHGDPVYSYAVTELRAGRHVGVGLAFTLGAGTELVCAAAQQLAAPLLGRDVEELMAEFGAVQRALADHPQLRWLGPHKGVVHLALASVTNACFDLWAHVRGVPLWQLLLDLDDDAFLALLDLSYLEDVLPAAEARALLAAERPRRGGRTGVLRDGYPGYDTSVGWFGHTDAESACAPGARWTRASAR